MLAENVESQHKIFEQIFSDSPLEKWSFHDVKDPLIRYLRDRRMKIGVKNFLKEIGKTPEELSVLVVCGGVGGEGTFLKNMGFNSVTVSDFSESAIAICEKRDARLNTLVLNAEDLSVQDNEYDLVLVQDGLHHLPRPALGFTEMLRVARYGVVVIEPHLGVVANILGREWERQDGVVNYVFRWNKSMFTQMANSYLGENGVKQLKVLRIWDHNSTMYKLSKFIFSKKLALIIIQFLYGMLDKIFIGLGNMAIGIVIKKLK